MFQRIGWRRPSAGERRGRLIRAALILAAVLLLGALIRLALT
ncbi:MAG: hypothetical protein ACE5HB_00945 [Terriglobia bacterium]